MKARELRELLKDIVPEAEITFEVTEQEWYPDLGREATFVEVWADDDKILSVEADVA